MVWVIGSKGMLGSEIVKQLELNEISFIGTDREVDITNQTELDSFAAKNPGINWIVNCAAYTDVEKAETEIELAEKLNAAGAGNIAKTANMIGAKMIHISTDYVFDGTKTEPYTPQDKPNPINNYGLTKYEGEQAVQKYCEKYYIARTSWLYGHHGKNFVETMISLADKPELKVVDDQVGCPTWTVELSTGIVKLLKGEPFGIYHVCGSGSTTWYGFAKEIFNQCNLSVNLKPCKTEEFPRPAKRPKNSIMNNNKICRNWKTALKNYIELRCEL